MASVNPKSLFDGQLANSKTTIYTVPVSTKCYLKDFIIANTSAVLTETVLIFVKRSGSTSRRVARFELLPDYFATVDLAGPFSAGDVIEAQTTTAATVDYIGFGAEETA